MTKALFTLVVIFIVWIYISLVLSKGAYNIEHTLGNVSRTKLWP